MNSDTEKLGMPEAFDPEAFLADFMATAEAIQADIAKVPTPAEALQAKLEAALAEIRSAREERPAGEVAEVSVNKDSLLQESTALTTEIGVLITDISSINVALRSGESIINQLITEARAKNLEGTISGQVATLQGRLAPLTEELATKNASVAEKQARLKEIEAVLNPPPPKKLSMQEQLAAERAAKDQLRIDMHDAMFTVLGGGHKDWAITEEPKPEILEAALQGAGLDEDNARSLTSKAKDRYRQDQGIIDEAYKNNEDANKNRDVLEQQLPQWEGKIDAALRSSQETFEAGLTRAEAIVTKLEGLCDATAIEHKIQTIQAIEPNKGLFPGAKRENLFKAVDAFEQATAAIDVPTFFNTRDELIGLEEKRARAIASFSDRPRATRLHSSDWHFDISVRPPELPTRGGGSAEAKWVEQVKAVRAKCEEQDKAQRRALTALVDRVIKLAGANMENLHTLDLTLDSKRREVQDTASKLELDIKITGQSFPDMFTNATGLSNTFTSQFDMERN